MPFRKKIDKINYFLASLSLIAHLLLVAHLKLIILLNKGVPQGQAYVKEPVKITKITFVVLSITLYPFWQLLAYPILATKIVLPLTTVFPKKQQAQILIMVLQTNNYGIANKFLGSSNTSLFASKITTAQEDLLLCVCP